MLVELESQGPLLSPVSDPDGWSPQFRRWTWVRRSGKWGSLTKDNSARPEQMSEFFIIITGPPVVLDSLHYQASGLGLTLQESERQLTKKTRSSSEFKFQKWVRWLSMTRWDSPKHPCHTLPPSGRCPWSPPGRDSGSCSGTRGRSPYAPGNDNINVVLSNSLYI